MRNARKKNKSVLITRDYCDSCSAEILTPRKSASFTISTKCELIKDQPVARKHQPFVQLVLCERCMSQALKDL